MFTSKSITLPWILKGSCFSIGSTTLDCFLNLLVFAMSLATDRRSDSFCEDDSDSFAWSMQIACRYQVSNFAGEGSQSFSFCESVILQCSVKYTVVIYTNRYSK